MARHKLREGEPRCQACKHQHSPGPCFVIGCNCQKFISRREARKMARKEQK